MRSAAEQRRAGHAGAPLTPVHRTGVPPGGAFCLAQGPLPSSRAGSHIASDASGAPVGVTSGCSGRHRPRQLRHPSGFPLREGGPEVTVDACVLPEHYQRSSSGHSREVGRATPAGPPPVGLQDRVQCPAEGGQVPVVDAAVIQLTGELAEQPRPVPAGRLEGDADFDPPLNHLHRRTAGGRCAALFPGSMPAGGRAPLRDRAPAARRDRSTAPSADRRGGAPFRPVRRWGGPIRTGTFYWGVLPVPAALFRTRPPSSPVIGSAADFHALRVQAVLR